jgi:hypothetical protein
VSRILRSSEELPPHGSVSLNTEITAFSFKQVFAAGKAEAWLPSSAFLLMTLSSRSDRYKEKLFTRPLSDCRFTDVAMDAEQPFHSLPMTPLFSIMRTAGSQSQSQDFAGEYGTQSRDLSQIRAGFIRATQEASFTQSQSQSQVDYFERTPASQRETRLFVDVRSTQAPASQGEGGGGGAMGPPAPVGAKRKGREGAGGAKKKRRVVMYRRYRQGELPDIEIPR